MHIYRRGRAARVIRRAPCEPGHAGACQAHRCRTAWAISTACCASSAGVRGRSISVRRNAHKAGAGASAPALPEQRVHKVPAVATLRRGAMGMDAGVVLERLRMCMCRDVDVDIEIYVG